MIQLFEGKVCPSIDGMLPVRNDKSVKPRGGLWTSSYHEKLGSDWVQWCLSEAFRGPRFNCYLLHPKNNVRVYTINYLFQLEDLIGAKSSYLDGSIDFESIARIYDGIRLTRDGQWATRLSSPSLYGWDCESTVWFRWCFEKVEYLGEVEFAKYE